MQGPEAADQENEGNGSGLNFVGGCSFVGCRLSACLITGFMESRAARQ
jgi:hypothetical protein